MGSLKPQNIQGIAGSPTSLILYLNLTASSSAVVTSWSFMSATLATHATDLDVGRGCIEAVFSLSITG